jgi:hypothetical protein
VLSAVLGHSVSEICEGDRYRTHNLYKFASTAPLQDSLRTRFRTRTIDSSDSFRRVLHRSALRLAKAKQYTRFAQFGSSEDERA